MSPLRLAAFLLNAGTLPILWDMIDGYHALGGDHFILSGHPHLEEAYWFGEGVIPILRVQGLLAPGAPQARELVAA
jgi:alkanesulfonate monooxygenase